MQTGFQLKKKTAHLTSKLHRLLSDRLLCLKEAISPSYPFLGLLLLRERLLLLGAVNLEMDNALKWPRCNKVSGHKTSNAL